MTILRTRELFDKDVAESIVKKTNYSYEVDRKMRFFVNMIIDRVLEDRKSGRLLSYDNFSTLKEEKHETS